MKIKFFSILLCIISIFMLILPNVSNADSPKMHRLQAGKPNSDGLYYAKSTKGNYSVVMPIPFNDFTIPSDNSDVIIKTDGIGSKTKEGIEISAARIFYRKKEYANKYFSKILNNKMEGEKERSVTLFNNHKAIDCIYDLGYTRAINRSILVGSTIIMLTIEYQNKNDDLAKIISKHFFKTLKIND